MSLKSIETADLIEAILVRPVEEQKWALKYIARELAEVIPGDRVRFEIHVDKCSKSVILNENRYNC